MSKYYLKSLCIAFGVLIAGCGESNTQQSGQPVTQAGEAGNIAPAALTEITIAQFGQVFLYLPLYVANDKGFFAEEGLDVTIVSTGGDDRTFAAVSSGSAQLGVADPAFVAIAAEQGLEGKVIASIVNGVTFWGVTYDQTIPQISEVNDFASKRIAVYTAPSTNYTVMKDILDNAEGGAVAGEIVQGAFGSLIAMLKAGQADIAMELEPVASIAVADGARIVYSMVDSFGDFAFTGLTATTDYLQSSPEVAQAAINGISRAMEYIYSDFDGALEVAVNEFPEVDESSLRNALQRLTSEGVIPRTPILTEEAWDKAIQLRKDVGDITGEGSYAANVDMTFAQRATTQ